MATHPSILAWRIPWTEEPGRLQSMGSKRVGHDYVTKHSKAQHSTAMSNLKMNNRFFISNKRNKIKFNKRCVRFAQWKLQNVEIKKIQMKSALCSWIGRLHILKMVCVCCAQLLQLRTNLFDPTECSLSGSSVHGILQAGILEWFATPSSRGSSQH